MAGNLAQESDRVKDRTGSLDPAEIQVRKYYLQSQTSIWMP